MVNYAAVNNTAAAAVNNTSAAATTLRVQQQQAANAAAAKGVASLEAQQQDTAQHISPHIATVLPHWQEAAALTVERPTLVDTSVMTVEASNTAKDQMLQIEQLSQGLTECEQDFEFVQEFTELVTQSTSHGESTPIPPSSIHPHLAMLIKQPQVKSPAAVSLFIYLSSYTHDQNLARNMARFWPKVLSCPKFGHQHVM